MSSQINTCQTFYLGVDGGGTKCRAIILDQNMRLLGVGEGGPSNPYQSVELCYESIINAADAALFEAGLKPQDKSKLIVGLGLAGVHVPSVFTTVDNWKHPFKSQYLTTDLHAACVGAHENEDGAVIIAGTGSCGFSCVGGKVLSLGGYGFMCGDNGSGAWLGLKAVQALFLASDDLSTSTLLHKLITDKLNASGFDLVDKLSGATSNDFGQLAPLVFDAADRGDEVAKSIVSEGANYLSKVAKKLLATNPPRLSVIGSVAKRMLEWMDKEVVDKISSPLNAPEFGAALLARSQYEKRVEIKKNGSGIRARSNVRKAVYAKQ